MKHCFAILSSTLVILVMLSGGLFWISKGEDSQAHKGFPPNSEGHPRQQLAPLESSVSPNSSSESSNQALTADSGGPTQPPGNTALLTQKNLPLGDSQVPAPSANPITPELLKSTREQTANGISITSLLAGIEMTDVQARAKVIEAIRLLEDRQNQAVIEEAWQLGIPTRLEGDDGQISVLHDIRGGEPLYLKTFNKNAAISTGANLLYQFPYNLNGTGIKIGVWDSGSVRASHQEFGSRVSLKNASASFSNHATHVAGTIGATGISPDAKGMAPLVKIDSYDWFSDFPEMTAAGATSAGDVSRIQFSNHSYGYYASTSDMGRYETEARDLDAIAASLPYYLPFWAAGNEQNELTALGGFQSITFNGLAKNIVTIGAVNDAVVGTLRSPSAGTIAAFSSLGPCDDGRIKPDLVANGINLFSPIGSSDSSYDTISGTSMATPNAIGSAALVTQLYAREFSGKRMPASTLKSLLIHTADDIGNSGPDYTYGWGLINVKAASDLIIAHKNSLSLPKIIEGQLTNANKTRTHTLIWDGMSPIRATLTWTDPAGTAQTSPDSRTPNLKHNLDTKITAPDGTTIYQPFVMPFVGTWTQAAMSALATQGKNNVDNIEQVYLATPSQIGTYTVTISINENLTLASQNYSLIMTGGQSSQSNPPPNILITSPIDGTSYLPGASVTLAAEALDFAIGGLASTVSQVEFFNGDISLGVDRSPPFSLSWNPPLSGTFLIRAKATDSEGEAAMSVTNSIHVVIGNGVPIVTSFTPAVGQISSRVTLLGSNFVNLTSVNFNGNDAEFILDSSNQISVRVPPSATNGPVSITNIYGTGTSTQTFNVYLPPVLISQIYCAGGHSNTNYRQDYIELYNRSTAPVNLNGWSIQYSIANGNTWQVATLNGTIGPGKFYLIGLYSAITGTILPSVNRTAAINLNPLGGKIALVNSTSALLGFSPLDSINLQDFLGFGSANAFEGAAAVATDNLALHRTLSNVTDTGNNAMDFALGSPSPRNLAYIPTPEITSSSSIVALANEVFHYQIIATFSPTSFQAGALPDGLSFNSSSGVISGIPTTVGVHSIPIAASNTSSTGNAILNLSVEPSPYGGRVDIFAENIGIGTATTSIATNVFQNMSKTFTGGGVSIKSDVASTGYLRASAGRNAIFPSGAGQLDISGINTLGMSDLTISFGHHKASTDSSNQLALSVSADGINYNGLSYSRPTGASSNHWMRISAQGNIPSVPNLRIRFKQTSTNSTYQFRIDDVTVTGTAPRLIFPEINVSGNLTSVSSIYGGLSTTTTGMTVSGSDLADFVFVSAPEGFEVSQSVASGFAGLLQLGGSTVLPSTPIFFRLAAATPAGFHSGSVVFSTTAGTTLNRAMPSSQVSRKLLTITASDLMKPFGTTLALGPNQTAFTTSGLVAEESVGSVTLTASSGASISDSLGLHTITPSSASGGSFNSDNYLFNYINGTLNVVPPSYAEWLTRFSINSSELNEDTDRDGIANGIENYLGTSPLLATTSLTALASDGQSLTLCHSRSNIAAVNLIPSYEWSTNLMTWFASGQQEGAATVNITSTIVNDADAPANDLIEATATVSGAPVGKLYLRLKVTKP